MKDISITQGGAAVLPLHRSVRVVSPDFENCALVVYRGKRKCLAVHDSGQLDLAEIKRALKYVGLIVDIGILVKARECQRHLSRLLPLRDELGLTPEPHYPRADGPFHACVDSEGRLSELPHQQRQRIHSGMPGYEAREAVAKLNDWFSPSGMVPLDLQYIHGDYTTPPEPKYSVAEMIEEMWGDLSYRALGMAVLSHYGRQARLSVPQLVHEFVEQHGLRKAPFGLPNVEQVAVFNSPARSTLANIRVP